jgi:hypothetical protein
MKFQRHFVKYRIIKQEANKNTFLNFIFNVSSLSSFLTKSAPPSSDQGFFDKYTGTSAQAREQAGQIFIIINGQTLYNLLAF